MSKKINYLFLAFSIFFVYFYLHKEKTLAIEELTQNIKKDQEYQLSSQIYSYKDKTQLIVSTIINKKSVLELQKKALNAKDPKSIDLYRKKLYLMLSPMYEELKKAGIKQLHFHFPDTTSFLRFHKPNKYGDNLKDIRYSLVLANTKKIEVSGFEEGRIFNGYRFIYPLFYEDQHIGSVETSVGSSALNKASKDVYNIHQYMILHKDVVKDKLFKNEIKNYEQSNLNKNFFHESNAFIHYKKEFTKNNSDLTLNEFNKVNKNISDLVSDAKILEFKKFVKFTKVNDKYYFAHFYPIKNVKEENIGYIISYKQCSKYAKILNDYIEKNIVFSMIVMVLMMFLYKIRVAQHKLRQYNKIAKEQRDLAINAANAKSEFLANMSHEIRTPLNAILGFIDILKKESTNTSSMKYINIISNSSQNLLQIIEDILDFSKIESGNLEIDKIDFDTKSEFELMLHLFEAKCSQKSIVLSLNLDESLPKFIYSDPLRIKQIISNFLSNAIKFTDVGKKIMVSISYENALLFISVKDQGKGIAEDKLEHIFEAFGQEDSSTTRKYGGTGLGLSICKELARLLDGSIGVKSTLGKGSEFYVYIPVGIGKEVENLVVEDEEIHFDAKVLVVEDNKTNQEYMKIILSEFGLRFDMANDGVQAIEMFKQNKYDLILMDENMPNMGGIEASQRILEIEAQQELRHTPLVALTANALKGDREKFLKAGMDEYLTKPLDIKKLIKVFKKILN